MSISQALTECPDLALGQACPSVATAFLDSRRPGPRRNGEVVELVIGIAELAQQDGVPRRVCLNAADGLRVLATGVTNQEQATQINDIADALCLRNGTASIGDRFGLFDSVGNGGAGGATGSVASTSGGGGGGDEDGDDGDDGDDDGDDGDDDGDDDETGGSTGLGSNDAASSPSQNGLDHANEHATDNTHGKNGQ